MSEFGNMMREVEGVGIGLDDCCAIQIADDTYRIIASQERSVAHRLFMDQDKLRHEILEPHRDFRSLAQLRDVTKPLGIPAPSPL